MLPLVLAFAGDLGAADIPAALMVYRVSEQGTDPFISRILVTPNHVRMDEGGAADAYTLFDRSAGRLFNVDPEERSVLVLDPPEAIPESPLALEVRERARPASAGPVDGVPARGWRLEANGRSCAVWDAVPGVMEAAAGAVAELYVQLARLHGRVLPEMPEEMLDACDLARNVYAPGYAWARGMPVTHEHGRMRLELLDHEPAMAVDASLFEVPESFRRMEMPAPGAP
jgi:hypothetical protein